MATRRQKRKELRASTGYRSGFEKKVADNLTSRGIQFKYEPDCIVFNLPIKGARCNACGAPGVERASHYTPDFKFANGSYVEGKGRFTSANRTRLAAFKRTRPDVVLRVLLQADNWLTSKHKQRYSDWLEKQGFEWAVGTTVPQEWAK